jgi:hypothetical protein
MKITISVVKADIGRIGGHFKPSLIGRSLIGITKKPRNKKLIKNEKESFTMNSPRRRSFMFGLTPKLRPHKKGTSLSPSHFFSRHFRKQLSVKPCHNIFFINSAIVNLGNINLSLNASDHYKNKIKLVWTIFLMSLALFTFIALFYFLLKNPGTLKELLIEIISKI